MLLFAMQSQTQGGETSHRRGVRHPFGSRAHLDFLAERLNVPRMVSQRDPTKFLLPILSGAGQVVVGVLFLVQITGDTFLGVLGSVLLILGGVSLIFAIRGYRRERARSD